MRLALLATLLLAGACRASEGDPAQAAPAERPTTQPESEQEPDPDPDPGTGSNSDTSSDAAPREIIRRRCKPGFSPCAGGRDCCDDRTEVCSEQRRCRPR